MYNLGPRLDGHSVNPGSNILITGPPLSGKRQLALNILSQGIEDEEGAIVVSTKESGERIKQEYEATHGPVGDRPLGIVDCVTKHQGLGPATESQTLKFASSPGDMTGIGIKLSEILEHFYRDRNVQHNRVLLHSLSTLVIYSNLQTVFRFLHVFTGRTQSADALGIYILESTAHDEKALSTLAQLFDGVIETTQEAETVRLKGSVA
ncbi:MULTISPECIES: recombinase RecA [unclassified Haladaptatus]|uniref:RAD55 family ATPase n=1 Tax=unclassified Haladaptatus TaxID=2622732 RepID=UPI0023E8DA2D|nr:MULTISPECIES: recombinase RecA [unclassified Haladaptatus]